jgi:hypothetical protein
MACRIAWTVNEQVSRFTVRNVRMSASVSAMTRKPLEAQLRPRHLLLIAGRGRSRRKTR